MERGGHEREPERAGRLPRGGGPRGRPQGVLAAQVRIGAGIGSSGCPRRSRRAGSTPPRCTVAVLPELEDVSEVEIDAGDLKVDTFRASGRAASTSNKTDSAIRITHLPTGMVVECQDERSQHKNRAPRPLLLRARLLAAERDRQAAERAAERRLLVGSGDRSQRVRTYNFPQGRITDIASSHLVPARRGAPGRSRSAHRSAARCVPGRPARRHGARRVTPSPVPVPALGPALAFAPETAGGVLDEARRCSRPWTRPPSTLPGSTPPCCSRTCSRCPARRSSPPRDSVGPAALRRFGALVGRRAAGEPLAWLTGRREFWSLDLEVDRSTLVPRPETERLVEAVLAAVGEMGGEGRPRVADLGTGVRSRRHRGREGGGAGGGRRDRDRSGGARGRAPQRAAPRAGAGRASPRVLVRPARTRRVLRHREQPSVPSGG